MPRRSASSQVPHDPVDVTGISLLDAIPLISPGLDPPYHLGRLPDLLEKAPGGSLRVCASPPVRHGKTTTAMHAIVYWLRKNPKLDICFLTYGARYSQKWSRFCRRLAVTSGVVLDENFQTLEEWRTDCGGGVYWASCDQEVIGRGFDIVLIDDPIGATEIWSAEKRDEVDEVIRFLLTRLNPCGSVIVTMSRMAADDPIGRRPTWDQVALPAIENENTAFEKALWPEVRSLEHLKEIRRELTEKGDLWAWKSQYQGDPPADQAGIFVGTPKFAGSFDLSKCRIVIGIDAAFTPGKRNDFFAAVVLAEIGQFAVVLEVVRHQRGTQGIVESLEDLKRRYPTARMASYMSGPEVGFYNFLWQEKNIMIEQMPARWNKGVRARPVADAWTRSVCQVLMDRPWSRDFVAECHAFSGNDDAHDDQVDALTSAWDALMAGRPAAGFESNRFTFGSAWGA